MFCFLLFCFVVTPQALSHAHHKYNSKIAGGQETTIEKHPYQVAISFSDGKFCGGSIISKNYIMTAAHCVSELASPYDETMVVKVGSSSRTHGTTIHITEVKSHPGYGSNPRAQAENDVAYMKTSKHIQFSDTIKAIKLPHINRAVDDSVTVTGWGSTTENGDPTETLMVIEMTVVDKNACRRTYGSEVTDDMWCGGNPKAEVVGVCGGDSGGPAVQDGMLVGIVSFSGYCGSPGHPSVFTNTASPSIRNFMSENTGI